MRCQSRIERPFPASWNRPARSRSRSSEPSVRSRSSTSVPCRRSATGMPSNRARWAGVSNVASPARSAGVTRATRWRPNWRALEAHQDREEPIQEREDDPTADRDAIDRDDHDHDKDEEPPLLQLRPDLPDGPRVHEREHHLRAVEGRDGDQVEDKEREVDEDEPQGDVPDEHDEPGRSGPNDRIEHAEYDRPGDRHDEVRDGPGAPGFVVFIGNVTLW